MIRALARLAMHGLLLAAIAGCAPWSPAMAPQQPVEACQIEGVKELVGETVSVELAERARLQAGATTVRTIRPGDAITKEYRIGRLNVWADAQGRASRFSCG